MTQAILDSYIDRDHGHDLSPFDRSIYPPLPPVTTPESHYENYLPVLILKDFNVAWTDRNWYLHEQDLVYLDERLGAILIFRGIARRTEVR